MTPRRVDMDSTGCVTAVPARGRTEQYAYYDAGNQTEASRPATPPVPAVTGTRAYQGTRIAGAGTVRYEHDALGRITLRQKTPLSASRTPGTTSQGLIKFPGCPGCW
ncbi:conserved hypothetical protein [Streptomyces pristinaespiralis ATCC 25486]|uniref:YD repeat-containing protein n=1 Tax=Streptomyces pristinaespiralis (strain ATCC 25486 / DSM 40338 / CBS 914.69 / JCM 4507 / KCC S-0507 / NBRC 13074 / NRRL 2958 / 5647) TaxID=457429 RepID=B5HJP7_STRE2|nr:conserved hypothetical protein [Streptomyces pristinaespiralis ATCC 25486]